MNFKFSVKQLLLITVIACAITIPRYPRYLSLDTHSQLKVSLIYAICLIIAGAAVVRLVYDHLKNERENLEENYKSDEKTENTKHIVINNYQTYKNGYIKTKEIRENTNIKEIKKISINKNNKIAVIHRLRQLTNESFEHFIENLFKFDGYIINRGPLYFKGQPQPDGGKDLIISKNNKIYGVQIKQHIDKYVPIGEVRDFWGALAKNEEGIFVTTSIFKDDSKNYCKERNIKCIDYIDLWNWINGLSENNKKYLENFINDINKIEKNPKYKPMTCTECGAPMKLGKLPNYSNYCLNKYEKTQCNNKKYIS